uniref:hypothetical protein n=1 Tax=uncultured Gimesia sp. TaxID=1678688 RepID=UPI00261F6726
DISPVAETIEYEKQFSVAVDGFVEIVDRYAAIDAGIDPAKLPEETQGNPGVSGGIPKLQPPQFHSLARSLPEENQLSKQQISDPEQIDVFPLLLNSDLETELPEVSKSETIRLIEDQPDHSDQNVFQALAEEISEGEDTLEELLAAQVYEVCAETRKGLLNALHEISNYSETSETDVNRTDPCVYDLVQPESEEANELEIPSLMGGYSDTTEKANQPSAASYRLDSHSDFEEQQSATSHLKGPALGRYKNLFTRLRRKQGLS